MKFRLRNSAALALSVVATILVAEVSSYDISKADVTVNCTSSTTSVYNGMLQVMCVQSGATPTPTPVPTATVAPTASPVPTPTSAAATAVDVKSFISELPGQSTFVPQRGFTIGCRSPKCVPVDTTNATIVANNQAILVGTYIEVKGFTYPASTLIYAYNVTLSSTPYTGSALPDSCGPGIPGENSPVTASCPSGYGSGGATVTPVPTTTPTVAPSPTPTAVAQNCTNGGFSAPNAYPDACYAPYATNSVWNTPISSYSPALTTNSGSTTWTNYYTSQSGFFPMQTNFGYKNAAQAAFGHGIYFSRSTDPSYTVNCIASYASNYCPTAGYHIPTYAAPPGGYAIDCIYDSNGNVTNSGSCDYADHHMAFIDQNTGSELDCWRVNAIGTNGNSAYRISGKISADSCSAHTITGNGLYGYETRSGFNVWAGEIRDQELVAGQINHALFMATPCTNNGPGSSGSGPGTYSVYPADQNQGTDTMCSGNQGAPYGSLLRLNMTDAQINALGVPAYKKAIYVALSHYGAYIGDTNGNNAFGFQIESDSMYSNAGYTNSNCPTTSPSSGIPCSPLTAYFHSLGDPGWNGSWYQISLNDISWNTSTIQWMSVPPH